MPGKITAFFLSISTNKNVILLLINVLLLVLGSLVDMAPCILISTPILLPVMMSFGVDPVHFGMIMLLNLGIGLCHPPVGSILFVGCAVGKVTIEQVMRTIWPFYAVMFAILMIVTYFPALSMASEAGFRELIGATSRQQTSTLRQFYEHSQCTGSNGRVFIEPVL